MAGEDLAGRVTRLARLAVSRALDSAEQQLSSPAQSADMGVGGEFVGGYGLGAPTAAEIQEFAKASRTIQPPIEGPRGPDGMPVRRPEAMLWDPWALVNNLGYKDRAHQVTFGTVRAVVSRVPVLRLCIQTRMTQSAAFARPQRSRFRTGFKVGLRHNARRSMTSVERKEAERLERMMLTGSARSPEEIRRMNHPSAQFLADREWRFTFANFLKAMTFDSLCYDQMTMEIVPDRFGKPALWHPVDATTIRLADMGTAFYDGGLRPRTVQVKDSQVINEWPANEMSFGVRNPSNDVYLHGYGTAEVEMVISAITALLHAWRYNINFFAQGTAPKGLLNIKGLVPDRHMRAFRRFWHNMVAGSENAWKTPITNSEGLEWINLQMSSRDMEFSNWLDFLIKVICGAFQMNPAEINFNYGNSGQQRVMFESASYQKLVDSRDRGLRPLMEFHAGEINRYIIYPINPDFELEFLGLDALTQDELAKLFESQGKTTHLVDELRAELDMDPLPKGQGQVLLNPTWMQWKQAKDMAAMGGEMPGGGEAAEEPEGAGESAAEPKARKRPPTGIAALLAQLDDGEGEDVEKALSPGAKSRVWRVEV